MTTELNIATLNNWGDYFSGNRKYPDVSVAYSATDITNIDKLKEYIAILGHSLQQRIKAINDAFGVPGNWLDEATLATLSNNQPTILVPSGGKDANWLLRAFNGTTKYSEETIWWVDLLKNGANVVFVVSTEEKTTYVNAFQSWAQKPKVIAYPGAGIGWGRYACMCIWAHLGKSCWMVDDRIHNLSKSTDFGGSAGARITTCRELEELQESIESNKQLSWKHVIYSQPFSNSAVATYLNSSYKENCIHGPSSLGMLKALEDIKFSRGFVFCKEDLSLHEVLERCVYDPTLLDENAPAPACVPFVRTDTHNPAYENTALNTAIIPTKRLNMINNLCDVDCFKVPPQTEGAKRTLTWSILKDEKGFKNKADFIKMQDAAQLKLLQVILEGYENLMKAPSSRYKDKKPDAHKMRQAMTSLMDHW